MTNLLDLALKRRDGLLTELASLDEFVRTAERLIKWDRDHGAVTDLKPRITPKESTSVTLDAEAEALARRLSRAASG